MEKSYRYLGYYLLLFIPLIALAFYRSYFVKFPVFEVNFDPSIHIHAFLASTWLLMLIVQPFLVTRKKLALHRTFGKLSYIVFPLLILSFGPGVKKLIDSGNLVYTFFPIGDCVLLILLYSLAIFHRKKAPKHMRFMIASSLTLLGPTIGRIGPRFFGLGDVGTQNLQYVVIFSILLGLILLDLKNKKDFRPYIIATSGFAIHAGVFYFLFLGRVVSAT